MEAQAYLLLLLIITCSVVNAIFNQKRGRQHQYYRIAYCIVQFQIPQHLTCLTWNWAALPCTFYLRLAPIQTYVPCLYRSLEGYHWEA